MPVSIANSAIVFGADLKFQHGVYPPTVRQRDLKSQWNTVAEKEYLLLCFWSREGVYPSLEAINTNGIAPNGGVSRACEKLGTFGVYRVSASQKTAQLQYWVDFDHWPVEKGADGKFAPIPGLEHGHRHVHPRTANQLPVLPEDQALYSELILSKDI